MDALEEFKQTYFQECDELLGDLETNLRALQEGTTEVETLHAALRAIHSIKGGAGAFGFDRVVSFSHTFETVLEHMREGSAELTEDCVAIAVRAGDIVAALITAARTGEEPDDGFETDVLDTLSLIAGIGALSENAGAELEKDDFEFTPIRVDEAPADSTSGSVPAANEMPAVAQQPRSNGVTAIRVDLDKVDRLVNMVDELVITQAMLSKQVDKHLADGYPKLVRGLEQLHRHIRGLQDSVMSIRAQPVNSVFSRMPRLVRQLSAQTGKKIRLEMSGEATEIDKTVIEKINDPLTHMIRNAADHGVESPEVREAAGKSPEGTIHLSAEHRGGCIVIQIADDGAGVNREKVRAMAVEKNLISAESKLSDEEIDDLIFLPGFSTADQVSTISGRGVGMDVVKKNIQILGGRVTVHSQPGKGSSVTMTLPLRSPCTLVLFET